MKLFVYPRAPYSKKVLVAAYEKGLDFSDRQTIQPFNREAMATMRATERQPLATIPLLRLDDGSHILESSIIVEWIDLHYPAGPKLLPADPMTALAVRAADRFADQLLAPTVRLSWVLRQPPAGQNAERVGATVESLVTALAQLEERLRDAPYVVGNGLTLADLGPSAAVHTFLDDRALLDDRRLPSLDAYPNTARWFEGLMERDSWRRLVAEMPSNDRVFA